MWAQITTLSEIDTIVNSSLIARNNPEETGEIIYLVAAKNDDFISLKRKNNQPDEPLLTIPVNELFDKGWWMQKD